MKDIRVGFMPLIDAAIPIAAVECGFAATVAGREMKAMVVATPSVGRSNFFGVLDKVSLAQRRLEPTTRRS